MELHGSAAQRNACEEACIIGRQSTSKGAPRRRPEEREPGGGGRGIAGNECFPLTPSTPAPSPRQIALCDAEEEAAAKGKDSARERGVFVVGTTGFQPVRTDSVATFS